MRQWQGCCPMPQASLLICLSPRILTCLLFGSVTGEDCPKMTATILSTKTLHTPDSFPRSLPALSSLQASFLHTKTPCNIKTQPWMVMTQPGELLQQWYWVIKGVAPPPKKGDTAFPGSDKGPQEELTVRLYKENWQGVCSKAG